MLNRFYCCHLSGPCKPVVGTWEHGNMSKDNCKPLTIDYLLKSVFEKREHAASPLNPKTI